MYGIPRNIDWSFFIGAEIFEIIMGSNYVIVKFMPEISLWIMSAFHHWPTQIDYFYDTTLAEQAVSLVKLFGVTVESVKVTNDTDLALHLSNGEILNIYDQNPHLESFHIIYEGGRIVV
ncbi:hypothetical protein BH11PLA1_BH11PLA1_01590 [soil metagenome]